ncbi:MAG: glycosyltransferase [Deltaproteobacteria bacterium]|nr:glycosyltransferase [Deltaproteobacteria bacterium]
MAGRHKVLFLIPNLQQGGAERQILELATRLPERFEPVLCLFNDTIHYREYLPPGQPRHVLGVGKMNRAAFRRLVEVLRTEKPQILQTYRDITNFWGRLAARRAPVPIVVTSVRNRAIAPLHLLTERWLTRGTDRVLTNSEGVRRELVNFARVPPDKIQIIHNFIDTTRFRPPTADERRAARLRWNVADDEIILLCPGRIALQKHQLGLILSLRMLKERGGLPARARLMLAGRKRDKVYATLLNPWLSWTGVGDQVTTLGAVSDMLSLYHAADILVLPSLYEGLPNAVLEGHACALPAVVSHAANIDRLVIEGETGFEVPTFDHGSLADALGKMLAMDPGDRRSMGARGRAHIVREFSVERVHEEVVALYDRLLREKGLA